MLLEGESGNTPGQRPAHPFPISYERKIAATWELDDNEIHFLGTEKKTQGLTKNSEEDPSSDSSTTHQGVQNHL